MAVGWGEPATSYEKNGNYINLRPGTINIMVFVKCQYDTGMYGKSAGDGN